MNPPVLNPHDTDSTSTKAFTKGKSFKKDMAILSIAYTLQESSELKRLIQLIVVIRDNDSKGQLTEVLETCARFSVQLASATTDAQRAETARAVTAFNKPDRSECFYPPFRTIAKLKTIQLNGDSKSLDGLMDMIKGDIEGIKPSFVSDGEHGTSEKLSKVLDITIGTTISILTLVEEASSLIPVPPSRTLGSIAEECEKLSRLNLLSRYLQQSAHMGDLEAIRRRLDVAIQLFQTENSVNIKLDTEELNRKFDFASLNGLPSHPDYTRNEYLEKSRDDVIRDVSDWIANAPESVLWVHGAAGLGKSTVAQELVHLLKSEDRLAGGIFLTNLTTESPKRVIQMISRQLGAMYPQAIANIADAARTLDGPHDGLRDYLTAYIFDPIRALGYPYQLVIVVDGLDEWGNYESFLAELVHIPSPSPLKFVLTSRFNYSIERAVDKMLTRKYPLPPASQTVIESYFHQHLLLGNINWRGRKPDNDKIHRLAARADGLLIWAATARSLVSNKFDTRYPHEILDQMLSSEEKMINQKDGSEDRQLERLYRSAISTSFPTSRSQVILRKFLAATLVLQEALPIGDFAHLSGIPRPAAEEIHQRLAALPAHGDPKTNLVSPATQRFHASFVEFITTESDDQAFQAISITEAHYVLASRCLEIVFVELLPSFRGKTCAYAELRGVEPYAVKFWPLHFSSGTPRQQLAPPSGAVGMELISEEAMHRWATLFLPCIAARFQDGHMSQALDDIQKSGLAYEIAIMIGNEDVTTLSYHIQCLEIATRLEPINMWTWKALGFAYHRLHEQSQSNRDLDEVITAFRHGLEPAPHPDRAESLNRIATALHTRYKWWGTSNNLDEAISLHREALLLRPVPHPDRAVSLNNLANALQTCFEERGASNNLDETISLRREALLLEPAPHPDRSMSLNNLANSLQTCFKQWGVSNDLDEAISLHQEALLLRPAPHPDHSMSLNNLANALQTRFEQWGASNDLDDTISLHQEALLLRPAPHPDHSMSLNNLANALQTRFEQRGASNDLDDTISLHQEALLLRPAPHPDRFSSLNNLANALRNRFEQWGTSNDLDKAISLHQGALLLCPAPHPDHFSSLNNLANALQARFEQQGISNNLDEAISLHQEALLLLPAHHPQDSSLLRNLAIALIIRFNEGNLLRDLTEAMSLYERLLDCPVDDPNRSWSLEHLLPELREWGALIGDHGDIFGSTDAEGSSLT
ncbi:uncharacterized protein LACBIDRAFT_295705 [Laccaria bicolor S238N-H82]|uniref:Predicted protein n=1 Tax=Laccaria bicolor (strain S238N-H82 / ATCC MYA-4686) TaxID=486041 RepID=B0DXE3_LACBS|nr:uncharacterized protein LACBIDRAFT_295705 [Laccaria bicolor S238N-H82]EDR00777.1 predicted protein [Laccaria bicolor S238N-H82]|eukprot:XP_001888569.1 predicted protein [Laccaria bicolor S238N-H82]